MKSMVKFLIVFSSLSLLVSCRIGQSGDESLTEEEMNDLIIYTRGFLAKSKIKITEKEKEKIKNKKPDVRLFFSNYDNGNITFSWLISPNRTLNVFAHGNLHDAQKCFWRVSITRDEGIIKNVDEGNSENLIKK